MDRQSVPQINADKGRDILVGEWPPFSSKSMRSGCARQLRLVNTSGSEERESLSRNNFLEGGLELLASGVQGGTIVFLDNLPVGLRPFRERTTKSSDQDGVIGKMEVQEKRCCDVQPESRLFIRDADFMSDIQPWSGEVLCSLQTG